MPIALPMIARIKQQHIQTRVAKRHSQWQHQLSMRAPTMRDDHGLRSVQRGQKPRVQLFVMSRWNAHRLVLKAIVLRCLKGFGALNAKAVVYADDKQREQHNEAEHAP